MGDDIVMISFSAKELLERMDRKLDDISIRVYKLEVEKVTKSKMKREWRELLVALATMLASVGTTLGITSAVH